MKVITHFRVTLCTEERGWFAEVVGILPDGLGTRWTAIASDEQAALVLAAKLIGEMKAEQAEPH